MSIFKGELQNNEKDIIYPHTSADVVFDIDGQSVSEKFRLLSLPEVGSNSDTVDGKHADDFILKTEIKNTLTETAGGVLDARQGKVLNDKITKINEDLDVLHTDLGQRIGQRFRSNDGDDIEIQDVIPNSYLQGLEIQGQTVNNVAVNNHIPMWSEGASAYAFNRDSLIPEKFKLNTKYTIKLFNLDSRCTHIHFPPGKEYKVPVINSQAIVTTHEILDITQKGSLHFYGYTEDDYEDIKDAKYIIVEGEHDLDSYIPLGLNSTEATITVNGEKHTFYEPIIEGKTEVIDGELVSLEPSIEGLPVLGSVPGISDTIDIATKIMTIKTKEYIIDGTENWTLQDQTNLSIRFAGILPDMKEYMGPVGSEILSNILPTRIEGGGDFNYIMVAGTRVWINIVKNNLNTSDLQGFKQWLNSNTVKIRYHLNNYIYKQLMTSEFNAYDYKKVICLNRIGDVKDELLQNKAQNIIIKKKLHKITLTGKNEEAWSINNESENWIEFSLLTTYINNHIKSSEIITSLFPYYEGAYVADRYGIRCVTSVCIPQIEKSKLLTPDINGWRKWLNDNNLELIYQLITPTIVYDNNEKLNIQLTDQQINISFDEGVKPSSYYVDVLVNKLIYDNQHEQTILTLNKATSDLERQIALLEYQQLIGMQ